MKKVKQWLSENKGNVAIAVLVFFIATLSFGLGYLTNREFNRTPIIIEKCSKL